MSRVGRTRMSRCVEDERIKVTNEVFGSVKLLKMYGWEESFERRLSEIRNRELKQLRKYQLLNIISSAMWSIAPILTSVATFGVYTSLGHVLEARPGAFGGASPAGAAEHGCDSRPARIVPESTFSPIAPWAEGADREGVDCWLTFCWMGLRCRDP